MMDAVHRYEGTVSRLMGDGLMAMFGAPVAHEDHAVRACYAALAMLESIARRTPTTCATSYGAASRFGSGLNSGEVIVRLISDDLHMDYTAMGQMVHLAARLEGLAPAGTRCSSATTLALVEGFVEVRPLGPTPVEGSISRSTSTSCRRAARRGPDSRRQPPGASPASSGGSASSRSSRQRSSAPGRARPGRRAGRRAGDRQVTPGPRGHPGAKCRRLAGPPEWRDLLRHGDDVPARDRPAQGVRSDRALATTRRPPTRSSPAGCWRWTEIWRPSCRRCWPCSTSRPTIPAGPTSIRRSGGAPRSTRSNACSCARARSSRCCWSSRISTGSTRRPRRC